MAKYVPVVSFVFAGWLAQLVAAQGVLIPHTDDDRDWRLPRHIRRPDVVQTNYSIQELAIDARIENQVARTSITQTFVNQGNRQIESQFVFPVPYDGAIDQLTFMVDGKAAAIDRPEVGLFASNSQYT